jgi:thiopeptide-type bacteriocin biosynthesis protein
VLAAATWTLSRAELEPVTAAEGADRVQALARLRQAVGLPRWICVHDDDNVLPVDLDNALAVDSFAQLIKSQATVVVTELWPAPADLVVTGPDGRYASELIIPLVRVAANASVALAPAAARAPIAAIRRSFAPGSEWLYAKLYTGHTTADHVLTDAIAPIVHDCPAWFFVRYADPHAHLRLRMRGEPAWLAGEILPRLEAATRGMLDDGRIWRLQLDTYEREVERYGGPVGIELAERLFAADSACVIDLVGMLDGEAEGEVRWRLAVRGIDQLLDDLGFELAERLAIVERVRDGFAREHGADRSIALQRGLGDRYRHDRGALESLLDHARDADSELAPGLERFAERSRANASIVLELRAAAARGALTCALAELAPSYLHMHVNRLIRSAARAHELVLYDLLVRLYESRLARGRRRSAG